MKKYGIVLVWVVFLAAPVQAQTFEPSGHPSYEHAREAVISGEWMKGPKFGKVKGPKVKMVKVKRPKYGKAVKRHGWGPPAHAVARGYRTHAPARVVRWR